MEILLIIGICMILLCALCGISIYLFAIGCLTKMHLPTIIWLFIFSTIAGGICPFFARYTYEGIVCISNIYLILGGIAALTLFRKVLGTDYKRPQILWIFFLVLLPLGVLGLLFSQHFLIRLS